MLKGLVLERLVVQGQTVDITDVKIVLFRLRDVLENLPG